VRVGSGVSTQHILNRELDLIRTVNAGIEAVASVTRHYDPPSYLATTSAERWPMYSPVPTA